MAEASLSLGFNYVRKICSRGDGTKNSAKPNKSKFDVIVFLEEKFVFS